MGVRQSSLNASTALPSVNATSSIPTHGPHHYTSGRWLRRDELERRSRFVDFNFTELCRRAIDVCTGAKHLLRYEKKEGASNRVFVMVMDNGAKVVARVPFSVAGPPRLTTNSEVATMAYLRAKTSIPIPKVLAWCDDASNTVGCEYMIMEHVEGTQLHERWPTMSSHQRILCVKSLGMIVRDMTNVTFPAYGSIYFADLIITSNSKVNLGDDFCLEPNCGPLYWNSAAGEAKLYVKKSSNIGPWSTLSDYCAGLIDTGRSRIPEIDLKPPSLPYHGSRGDHIKLLEESEAALRQLIDFSPIQEASLPTLLHYDLHKRNVYVSDVDPTIVTGIIDWQSTSIEPGIIYANEIPDFTTYGLGSPFSTDDVAGNQLAPVEFDTESQDRRDAKRPFYYAATSSRDIAAAVRQGLIEVSQRWQELGLPGSCSYQPSVKELEEHQKHYHDFETAQKLKLWLMAMLNMTSDGWVPCEAWDSTREANRAAFKEWMISTGIRGNG